RSLEQIRSTETEETFTGRSKEIRENRICLSSLISLISLLPCRFVPVFGEVEPHGEAGEAAEGLVATGGEGVDVANARIEPLELAAAPRVEPEKAVAPGQPHQIVGGVGPDAGQRQELVAQRFVVAAARAPAFDVDAPARDV